MMFLTDAFFQMCVVGHMWQGLDVTAVVDLNLPTPMPAFCMKHIYSFRVHLGESIVKNRGLLRIYDTSGNYTKAGCMY